MSAHLDDEERLVVPLAAVTMTQDEWNAIGEHARGSIPQEQIFLVFGLLLEPLDDDERAFMLAPLPPPVRELWDTVGEPGWEQYSAQRGRRDAGAASSGCSGPRRRGGAHWRISCGFRVAISRKAH